MRKSIKKVVSTALTASMVMSMTAVAWAGSTDEEVKVTYPLETEDELTIWSCGNLRPESSYVDWTESPFHTGLEKMTGIHVEWQFASDPSDEASAYNLMLTDDVLPDMIFYSMSATDAQEYIEDGMIYDLTEYLPKYAPDYWAYLTENPQLQKYVKTADGAFFGFGTFIEGDYNKTYTGPAVRQDWLDECGLEAPVTLEDWENMLVTFKEKYGARLGFTEQRFGNASALASGTGAMATWNGTWYADDDGKIQYAQAQPEWKEYMSVLNKWWEMGLIDEDSITMSDADMRTKVANNEIGATSTAMSQITNYLADAEATESGAQWVGIEYPRTAEGEPTCMIQTNTSYNNNVAVVTTSCPEDRLITALAWLNYGYSEEGMTYWNFGEEGVSYTVDEDGNYAWTDVVNEDPKGLNAAISKYSGTLWAGISVQASKLVEMKNNPVSAAAVYKWVENTEVEKHYVPSLALGVEEGIEYGDLITNIKEVTKTAALEFITGDRSLDEFDAFVEELNALGLERCQEIQQDAYDTFMGN